MPSICPRRPRTGGGDDRILPLINIVFLLLIFFMVAGRLSPAEPFSIEPPRSENGRPGDAQDMLLLIGADGTLALDGSPMEPAGLQAAIAGRLESYGRRAALRPEAYAPVVYVKADGGADAAAVVGVLEELRRVGVVRVRLMTVPPA